MTEPVLKIRSVSKKIRDRMIVQDISFDVEPGEVFGLLGPNGAGKTTIIRMITGLISMTEGDIWIGGAHIRTQFEEAIRHVGAVVENPEFYKFMTGYQNLLHYARMVPGVDKARINEVVSLVKLNDVIHDPVKTYSLGMRQRLGVAQAILHKPALLILDEPTNGLDPAGIRELRDYLRRLAKKEKTAIVISSHLLSEMELMCDRVAILQNGRLVGVQKLGEWVKENEEQTVRFEVDRADGIRDILKDLGWKTKWRRVSGGFEIALEREQIAELNLKLVKKGIKVYGIKTVEKTLEDKFLEVTEGDPVV
jgi:ABC-2 type transport system ATP-binding protein